ncbi:MAG: adenylosuccinate lyase [Candidatus Nezhaarchaeota archaeon]|nr:adenylosuccinate lyase [Candidatus Nezhaarchaeota archaeon]MCX8141432.1 adenylosuccinate lyase [Candidatus Nezhaarchaeota archaeon]MDW8049698.1 adenylosuccinate lyase [Nitrososphaerota archaeon]
MSILPIDSGRYGSEEMRRIFTEEARLQRMLDVEAALARASAKFGLIPTEAAEVISERANTKYVRLERVKEIEAKIRHDVMAVVEALAEVCGEYGGYVHVGATSYDIVDTAMALQLKDALFIIEARLKELCQLLCNLAVKYKEVVMVGRTHGQHALPITLGFKFAVWASEFSRHIERLIEAKKRVLVGKMSGAVGTMAGFMGKGLEIQEEVMRLLGLRPATISTQIVQRDRLAELISLFAIIASSLDCIATEIRNLQRPEIMELAEGFGEEQVGSSTMPHKQNPIDCENVSSLAKLMRSLVIPALENIPLWHERDLTNSANERFIIPESCIILDEMLRRTIRVLKGLRVYPENMRRNLELTKGRIMSEAIMIALTMKGMSRQEAHRLLREITLRSTVKDVHISELLKSDPRLKKLMSDEEIERLLKPENYLGETYRLIDMAVREALSVISRI